MSAVTCSRSPTAQKQHSELATIKANADSDSLWMRSLRVGGLCRVNLLSSEKRTHRKTPSFAHTPPPPASLGVFTPFIQRLTGCVRMPALVLPRASVDQGCPRRTPLALSLPQLGTLRAVMSILSSWWHSSAFVSFLKTSPTVELVSRTTPGWPPLTHAYCCLGPSPSTASQRGGLERNGWVVFEFF